jgi:hypothetical protein
MSTITIQFMYKNELRTGTVEIDPQGRRGLITLKTDKGFRSYRCDDITQVKYVG